MTDSPSPIDAFPALPRAYVPVEKCGAYFIGQTTRSKMFSIFDADGNVYAESDYSTLERARAAVPSIVPGDRFRCTFQSTARDK